MDPVIILELNHFANLCGHFYNAEYHDFSLPNCNNGYNCNRPDQEEDPQKKIQTIHIDRGTSFFRKIGLL